MKINDIFDEFGGSDALITIVKYLSIGIFVILLAIYIGNIFFGTNSLEVQLNLSEYKSELEARIDELQKDNARLQKEYFELKQLEPQE